MLVMQNCTKKLNFVRVPAFNYDNRIFLNKWFKKLF